MKFSIVIPIYKVERYLKECVDSVLSQSYQDFEVILVDDGSPDNCPKICDDYAAADSRVQVIHQENAGVACARNAGISHASGEYLICIDGDDYFLNHEVLRQIADKITDSVDVVLFGFKKFFESNGLFGRAEIPFLEKECSSREMLKRVLEDNTYCGAAWTKAVKLNILRDNNIEFIPGMISEDIDWYLHLLCYAKKFYSINDVALVYRQRPESLSHAPKLNSLIDNLFILEKWPVLFRSIIEDKDLINYLLSIMAYYYANDLILYSIYPAKISRPFKNRLKSQSYLLDYAITPRASMVKRFYRVFGFDITILSLKLLSIFKIRK